MKKDRTKKRNPGDKPEGWVDVHNDDDMRKNGLWRPYDVTPRDPSVWTKTPKEKAALKKAKSIWKLYGK